MKNILFIFASYFSLGFTIGQQTVGLFSINDSVEDGYVLFGPKYNNTTYLIDNCGNLQFSWNSNYKAGGSVKLLPNGNLIRSCVFENNSPIVGGGAGGRIECIKPNQLIEWSINLSNDSIRQHHDYEILPNGNIIMIIWELKSLEEAISEGRDSSLITASGLWVDYIIEYSPDLDSIVWEWHTWDHLIQNYDSTKPNYGHPTIHDELFDLNFSANGDEPDWQHLNSIDYNDSLDLILLCSPFWNEIYFIDHSTTMFEASSHIGGNYGKGGDILWRWGNPITYGAGDSTNQKFFGQHDAHWIDAGKPDAGKIIIFNNGKNKLPSPHSSVNIISHPVYNNNQFSKNSYGAYLPDSFYYEFLDTTNMNFYSKLLSSADQLGNGNILINEGVKGHFFEISKNGDIVWDYISPVVSDSTMTQGVTIPGNSSMLFNASFRARKIHPDFNGLNALPLLNHGPIELNPINTPCSLSEIEEDIIELSIFPNPSSDIININLYGKNSILEIYSVEGNKILEQYFNYQTSIDVTNLPHGIYIVQITNENKETILNLLKIKSKLSGLIFEINFKKFNEMKKFITLFTLTFLLLSCFAQLPNINIKDMEGNSHNFAKLNNNGKPMIISFWATWCKPCKAELNTIAEEYDDWVDETGVKLIAVSIDDARSSSRVEPYVNAQGWEYLVLMDPNSDLRRAMGVNNVPHTFLVDGTGKIVWDHNNYSPGDEEELYEKLTGL